MENILDVRQVFSDSKKGRVLYVSVYFKHTFLCINIRLWSCIHFESTAYFKTPNIPICTTDLADIAKRDCHVSVWLQIIWNHTHIDRLFTAVFIIKLGIFLPVYKILCEKPTKYMHWSWGMTRRLNTQQHCVSVFDPSRNMSSQCTVSRRSDITQAVLAH